MLHRPAMVIWGDDDLGNQQEYWIQVCSVATKNIILAAHTLGSGAVRLEIHRINTISELLDLPSHIHSLSLVAKGHRDETPKTNERYNLDRIHHNKEKIYNKALPEDSGEDLWFNQYRNIAPIFPFSNSKSLSTTFTFPPRRSTLPIASSTISLSDTSDF